MPTMYAVCATWYMPKFKMEQNKSIWKKVTEILRTKNPLPYSTEEKLRKS